METSKRPPRKAVTFSDPQSAIEGMLQARVSRLFESNELLAGALVKLRDFYLAGIPPGTASEILEEIEAALASAANAEDLG